MMDAGPYSRRITLMLSQKNMEEESVLSPAPSQKAFF